MLCIVYVSSASWLLSGEELRNILRSSRRNNERLGVTGMLLYRGGNFIQALEGPERPVRQVYDTLCHDPRHGSIIKIADRPLHQRFFPDWTMGFYNADKLPQPDRDVVTPFLTEPAGMESIANQSSLAYKLLLSFKRSVAR